MEGGKVGIVSIEGEEEKEIRLYLEGEEADGITNRRR